MHIISIANIYAGIFFIGSVTMSFSPKNLLLGIICKGTDAGRELEPFASVTLCTYKNRFLVGRAATSGTVHPHFESRYRKFITKNNIYYAEK